MDYQLMMSALAFNASSEELVSSGAPLEGSIKVANAGYLASLGVYHELHCLRRMRLWLYRDVYFPNATEKDVNFFKEHLGKVLPVLFCVNLAESSRQTTVSKSFDYHRCVTLTSASIHSSGGAKKQSNQALDHRRPGSA
jgi:hypothetical protein